MSDLDQAATVTWVVMDEIQIPNGTIGRSSTQKFESVSNAVTFVMETLSPMNRTSAMIHTDSGDLQMAAIEIAYGQLKRA